MTDVVQEKKKKPTTQHTVLERHLHDNCVCSRVVGRNPQTATAAIATRTSREQASITPL